MTIGIDIRHLATKQLSGVGQYTMKLIKELSDLAPSDELVLFSSGTHKARSRLPNFSQPNIRLVHTKLPNKLVSLLLLLPVGITIDRLASADVDVWLFPNINIIKTRRPYVVTVHDLSFLYFKKFFTIKQRLWHALTGFRRLFSRAHHLLAVSASTKQDLVETLHLDPDKITVTHLGVDDRMKSRQQPSDNNFLAQHDIRFPYILTLSTREPRKNICSVVDAYDRWRQAHASKNAPRLVIAGGRGWKNRDLTTSIKNAWFKKDIHVVGYVPEQHKPALYRGAQAFLFPSFYEGFGLPAIEAMACGTPVITSFTGSMPEIVDKHAILVDPYNVTDIEQALKQLVHVSARLRAAGESHARQFSWKKTATRTRNALKKILQNS